MDGRTEPEKPNQSETPTADAVAEFLKGVKEIHERQRVESAVDPEATRVQSKEFAQLTEEIMAQVQTLPADETQWDTAIPGIQIQDFGDHNIINIRTEEAALPFNPLLLHNFIISQVHENKGTLLNQTGVTPKYVITVGYSTDPNVIPPFRSTPVEGTPQAFHSDYFFDESGDYLKVFGLPSGIATDLEQLPEGFSPEGPQGYKDYKAEMTPEDFEFVGMALSLIKGKLPPSPVQVS